MNQSRPTGLGVPETVGKRSLFKPPEKEKKAQPKRNRSKVKKSKKRKTEKSSKTKQRIRMTMDITKRAMAILQDIQNRYRLETGRALPLWKVVSRAIEFYGEAQQEDG